jgi:hypothetical protein
MLRARTLGPLSQVAVAAVGLLMLATAGEWTVIVAILTFGGAVNVIAALRAVRKDNLDGGDVVSMVLGPGLLGAAALIVIYHGTGGEWLLPLAGAAVGALFEFIRTNVSPPKAPEEEWQRLLELGGPARRGL